MGGAPAHGGGCLFIGDVGLAGLPGKFIVGLDEELTLTTLLESGFRAG
jgi:hypothetical protein